MSSVGGSLLFGYYVVERDEETDQPKECSTCPGFGYGEGEDGRGILTVRKPQRNPLEAVQGCSVKDQGCCEVLPARSRASKAPSVTSKTSWTN